VPSLTPDDLTRLFLFAVRSLEPALIADLRSKNETARRLSQQLVAERMAERLNGCEVTAPEEDARWDWREMDR